TATANTIADGTLEIHATIDTTGYTITKVSIRDKLQLADSFGIAMLPNDEIFEVMGQIGYPTDGTFTFWKSFFTPQWRYLVHHLLHCISSKSDGWDQFGSNIATALICLSTGQEHHVVAQSQPSSSTLPAPSTSSPPAQGQMTMDDLLQVVPQLMSRIDSLETDLKTKPTSDNGEFDLLRLVTLSMTIVNALGVEQVEEHKPLHLKQAKTSLQELPSLKAKKKLILLLKELILLNELILAVLKVLNLKEQVLQEEASLAEAIRLDTLQKEEVAKQVHLDSLLAQRIAEEEELNEQQKKRKAQVQFEAQHYTNEDWDLIRAKIEANAELSKSMLGSELQGEDFAKKMVDLVNQRKKYFAEERARAKRNKPMTQSQLKTYMMNYLKNQGTWKLSQLKNLSFEEVKEEFDKLVKQTKTPKRLKDDEAKDDESTKKFGKRRKQMARKGLHTSVDKDDSEDSDEVSEQDDSVSGEIGSVPIVWEDGSDIVYGMDGPEDKLEKVMLGTYFKELGWKKTLSTNPSMDIYMLIERKYPLSAEICKAMLDKKLQGGKPDEDCYKMLKMMEKQASIRK
ncbi:hypothetical protein Tco_1307960, partial [Tanacetum coccineum]